MTNSQRPSWSKDQDACGVAGSRTTIGAWGASTTLRNGRRPPTSGLVSDVMTPDVVCVSPDLSIAALEHVLLERGISGVPVVDDEGRPIGMVSKTDIVCIRHERRRDRVELDATVAEIMMPIALCLPAHESIGKAAALMAFEGVHRVPVVDASGEVVGLVSSLDALRWFARSQGYVIADPA